MKKLFVTAAVMAVSFSVGSAFAYTPPPPNSELQNIIEEIAESVQGLDLFVFNAAVNTADINGSVTIEASGDLKSAFPFASGWGTGMKDLDDTLSTFINKIDTVAIGAYNNGTIEIAGETLAITTKDSLTLGVDITLDASDKDKFIRENTEGGYHADSFSSSFSHEEALKATLAADLAIEESLDLKATGPMGDTIAFNAALNTGDIDASVSIGGLESGNFGAHELAHIDFSNVQISTQAIGAYNAGVVNVGFSAPAAVSVK